MPHAATSAAPEGYRTQSPDTSYDVERRLIEAWRAMPAWEKARQIAKLTATVESLALAGIAARHPDANEHERRLRLAALRLDRETMIRVFGWDPVARGY